LFNAGEGTRPGAARIVPQPRADAASDPTRDIAPDDAASKKMNVPCWGRVPMMRSVPSWAGLCHRQRVHMLVPWPHAGRQADNTGDRMDRRQLLGAGLVLATGASARAQSFPGKPIRLIVPFPPGGGTDFIARTVATRLAEATGWTVVPDNKAGAGGTIGIGEAAKAEASGHTLVLAQLDNLGVAPLLYKNLPYQPQRDLQPVINVADFPIILLTSAASPYKTLADVVAAAREPGRITFASAGNGTVSHLVGELFQQRVGVKMQHIPYKGSAPALVDVLSGQVTVLSSSIPSALAQVQAGKLRPLAVSSAQRSSILPEVPTIAESGVKNFDVNVWYAVFAPSGVPASVVAQLNTALGKMLQLPDVAAAIQAQGGAVRPGTPQALGARLEADIAQWRDVIAAAKIQLE
jgi:tripartite-type tricarboxylate transporter receptor subunit TctC